MRREQALEELHTTARKFIRAESQSRVAEIAVEAMEGILGMSINSVHLYDGSEEGLAPIAWTDSVEDILGMPPTIPVDGGLAWEVFETGDPRHYGDVSAADGRLNQETDLRSEIILPLEGHGVILIGSTESDSFTESDVWLAETVAAHLTTALDRIERETELRRERERFGALFDSLPEPVTHVRLGEEPIVQDVNPAFEETFGYDRETVVGNSINDVVVPEGKETEARAIDEQIRTDGTVRRKIRRETANGMRDFLFTTVPVDRENGVEECFGIAFDITDQREYERQLEQKNERLEGFASIVSHDLRNPLNVVKGRLNHLKEQYDEDEHLEVALRSIERMDALITDLLTLAREGEAISEVEPVELAEVVRWSWQNVETENADLVVDSERVIQADANRTQELLENLLRNSLEHGRADETDHDTADESLTISVGDLPDGFYVEDDGTGIPPGVKEEVFDSGFTTSEDGTGFGLAIVDQIADAHGWEAAVTEGADGGARFEFRGVDVVE